MLAGEGPQVIGESRRRRGPSTAFLGRTRWKRQDASHTYIRSQGRQDPPALVQSTELFSPASPKEAMGSRIAGLQLTLSHVCCGSCPSDRVEVSKDQAMLEEGQYLPWLVCRDLCL